VGDRSERSRRGTIRFDVTDQAEYLQAVSLVGRVWFLTKKRENRTQPRIIIGRTSEADVVIPELSISVEHCALQATPFGLAVVDLNSTNGTYVNGQRIAKNEIFSLHDGAKLALGRFEFEYLRHREFLTRLKQIALQRPLPR
jgi:pSer/pThr/pTyr-binding forkhead associated (FHA) protein